MKFLFTLLILMSCKAIQPNPIPDNTIAKSVDSLIKQNTLLSKKIDSLVRKTNVIEKRIDTLYGDGLYPSPLYFNIDSNNILTPRGVGLKNI